MNQDKYCIICHKSQTLGIGGFTYKLKNLYIHNKCKEKFNKLMKMVDQCNWCHEKMIFKCSLCGKKIGSQENSGGFVIQPHSFHEYCSNKCKEYMWKNHNKEN